MYIHYKNTREHAWHYLIRHKIKSLPVDVFSLCQKDKHLLFPYSSEKAKEIIETLEIEELLTTTDGFTMRIAEHTMIFWNDALSPQRQRSLLHTNSGTLSTAISVQHRRTAIENRQTMMFIGKRRQTFLLQDSYRQPVFSGHFKYGTPTRLPIYADCQKRQQSGDANGCLNFMKGKKRWLVLHKKSCFLLSPSEQQVFKQFRRYIHKQKRLLSSRNKQSPLL